MTFRSPILFAVLVSCSTLTFAQDGADQIVQGPVPAWAEPGELLPLPDDASGLVFYRKQENLVRLHSEGEDIFLSERFKILQTQGLQLGNIQIVWNPASGAPIMHTLKIHRDGIEIDVLETSKFEILRREDQLDEAVLTGLLTAILRVPDLRVEDELEISYTLPTADPTLGAKSYGLMTLADAPSPGRFRLELSWDEGQEPKIQLADTVKPLVERSETSLELLMDNPGIVKPPRDAPFRYNWIRTIEYSDFKDWAELSQRFHTLFETASALDDASPVKQEAARIAAAHSTDKARAAAALKLVQQQVRYIYVGLNGGNFSPATADETWQRRYGDCKGKTTLLMALLAELGIEAEAVLASNSGVDDGYDQRLPSPNLFDHILVRALIDGQQVWMDGTFPPVGRATQDPVIGYQWVLPLSEAGTGLEKLPRKPFALPQEMGLYEIDARAGFDEPAKIASTQITRGVEGLVQHIQFSSLSAPQLENAFRSNLEGSASWDTVESVKYRFDQETLASVLTIIGTGPVDWEEMGNDSYSLTLPGGGFNPPQRRTRGSDEDKTAPYYSKPVYSCYATTVRIPGDTKIGAWYFNGGYDDLLFGRVYYRAMEKRDDGTLRMIRGARQQKFEITPENAASDNKLIASFDNSKARVYYSAGVSDVIVGDGSYRASVPATYERDWTAADVPCLPEYELEESK